MLGLFLAFCGIGAARDLFVVVPHVEVREVLRWARRELCDRMEDHGWEEGS